MYVSSVYIGSLLCSVMQNWVVQRESHFEKCDGLLSEKFFLPVPRIFHSFKARFDNNMGAQTTPKDSKKPTLPLLQWGNYNSNTASLKNTAS